MKKTLNVILIYLHLIKIFLFNQHSPIKLTPNYRHRLSSSPNRSRAHSPDRHRLYIEWVRDLSDKPYLKRDKIEICPNSLMFMCLFFSSFHSILQKLLFAGKKPIPGPSVQSVDGLSSLQSPPPVSDNHRFGISRLLYTAAFWR